MSPLISDSIPARLNPNFNFTAEFIEMYKSLPCLWDTKSPKYFRRNARQKAYAEISNKFREVNPDISANLVCKKINNLRSTYRKELRKVQASKKRGDLVVYKPSLWYFHRLDFLYSTENQDNDEKMKTIEDEDCDTQDVKLEFCSTNEADDETNTYETAVNTIRTNFTVLSSSAVERSVVAGSINDTSSPSAVLGELNIASTLKRVPLLESNLHTSVNSQTSPSNQQRSVAPNVASVYGKFGAYIADELTVMQPDVSAVCQKLINDVIFEAKCGTISRNSRIVT